MPSASTTGSPIAAAQVMGSRPFPPPISTAISAATRRPVMNCRCSRSRAPSSPFSNFSRTTVVAPIPAHGMISASSGNSSKSTNGTGPKSSVACNACSSVTYASPPPPAPRMAQPRDRARNASGSSSLFMVTGIGSQEISDVIGCAWMIAHRCTGYLSPLRQDRRCRGRRWAWPRNEERPSRRARRRAAEADQPGLCRAGETAGTGETRATAGASGASGIHEENEPVRSTVTKGCAEGTGRLPGHLCHSDLVAKVHRVLAPHHLRWA